MLAALAAQLILSGGLYVATSRVDITPSVPLPLGGYTERGSKLSGPGGDRLYARTVLFLAGTTKIAVVSVETLTIPESFVREVKKRIPSDVTLFLAATHTHSAPDSQMLNERMTFSIPGIAKFDRKWLKWYADKIGEGILSARKQTDPAFEVGIRTSHADVNTGRRKFADPDQTVTEVRLPLLPGRDFIRPPARWLFLHYAAHGTVYSAKEMKLKGDWPGEVSRRTGLAVLQGAIGDVLPKESGPTAEDSVAGIANALLRNRYQTWDEIVWEPGMPLSTAKVSIALDPVQPHPTMAKSYGVPEGFAAAIVKQFAPPSAEITAFRIGKLAVVGVPGEPTSILGRQIRDAGRRMGFSSVLVCSHVNGWMGYILDPEDYDRGGYEATLSFYGREEGTKVVDAAVAALKALRARGHR
jgi:hypothetical protein